MKFNILILAITIFSVVFLTLTASAHYQIQTLTQDNLAVTIISRPEIQAGDVILVGIKTTVPKESLKAEFMGNKIPIIYSPDKLWCFIGVDVRKPGGAYNFSLYQTNTRGAWKKIFERPIAIKKLATKPVKSARVPKSLKSSFDFEKYKQERRIIVELLAKGESDALFKTPFTNPLNKMEVTQGFGITRIFINTGLTQIHAGLDLRAPEGTKIYTINDGKVIIARQNFTLEGNLIAIDHGGGIISYHMHLQEIKVKEGDLVNKGSLIGLAGNTGESAGAHLHFSIKINGQAINPSEFIEIANTYLMEQKNSTAP